MWVSIPTQDCLVSFDLWVYNFCLWAYSFWEIWKVFSYQYKDFSTGYLECKYLTTLCGLWELFSFHFFKCFCTTLGSFTLCMSGLLLSRDSWWPLCRFLEVFFAWLPAPELSLHITFALASSNTDLHFLSSYCWTLSFLLLRLVPENCVWALLVFIFWRSQSCVI